MQLKCMTENGGRLYEPKMTKSGPLLVHFPKPVVRTYIASDPKPPKNYTKNWISIWYDLFLSIIQLQVCLMMCDVPVASCECTRIWNIDWSGYKLLDRYLLQKVSSVSTVLVFLSTRWIYDIELLQIIWILSSLSSPL